jgi:hypothetical protein
MLRSIRVTLAASSRTRSSVSLRNSSAMVAEERSCGV